MHETQSRSPIEQYTLQVQLNKAEVALADVCLVHQVLALTKFDT